MSRDKLILAIQSKGRLAEQTQEFFAQSGVPVITGAGREYTGSIKGMDDVDIVFLQSGEIPGQLESGSVHLGITGEDLMREKCFQMDKNLFVLKPLGFGRADLVVAVPRAWIDVDDMADLDEVCADFHIRHRRRLRVATKYLSLTRDFFARHGIADYRIAESLGATEGAPASGSAEVITDITSTGATLMANHLKLLDDGLILRSQACLAASLRAKWGPRALASLRRLLDMVEGKARAADMQVVRFTAGRNKAALQRVLKSLTTSGCKVTLEGASGRLQCANDDVHSVIGALHGAGCAGISAARAEYIFSEHAPVFDDFVRRLKKS